MSKDPHKDSPVVLAGENVEEAAIVIVLLHGRGSDAQDMLSLYEHLNIPNSAALALEAVGNTWYPNSFLASRESNQPFLDSALLRLAALLQSLQEREIPTSRIALLGFSQGACLSLEFVARNPRRYAAVLALSGGLIGEEVNPGMYDGSLQGTQIFLGCSDPDPHIPFERVHQSRDILLGMQASVELRRYPGLPHSVNEDEVLYCRELLCNLAVNS